MVSVNCYWFSTLDMFNCMSPPHAVPTGAPACIGLNSTSVGRRSLNVVWGTVPCSQQRRPITGYRLHALQQ